jgi:hypothetical protein
MTLNDIEASWLESQAGVLRTLRAAADRLEHHVVPVFHAPNESELLSAGSGVLARIKDRAFLISAAHVLDHCTTGVFVPTASGETIEPLANPRIVTGRPPGTTREDDRIDIGFVRLTEQEATTFGMERMLDLDAVSGPPMPIATTMFLVLGFPHRDHSSDPSSGTLTAELTSFMTGVADDLAYRRARVDARTHLLLRFERRTIVTKKSVGAPPDMTGISGGGVWPVRIDLSDPTEQTPLFAGLVVERPRHFRSSLAVTRGTVIRYFVERFDEGSAE